MGTRTTESRTVQKPVKWTPDEWAAVEKFAMKSGISPTNLARVITLAAIDFNGMVDVMKNARQFAMKAASMKRKTLKKAKAKR